MRDTDTELDLGDLQRTVFVYVMGRRKKEVRLETKARWAADVRAACAAVAVDALRDAYHAGFVAACSRDAEDFDGWLAS